MAVKTRVSQERLILLSIHSDVMRGLRENGLGVIQIDFEDQCKIGEVVRIKLDESEPEVRVRVLAHQLTGTSCGFLCVVVPVGHFPG